MHIEFSMYLTAWGYLYRVTDIWRSIEPSESSMVQLENVETNKFAWIQFGVVMEHFEEVNHAS